MMTIQNNPIENLFPEVKEDFGNDPQRILDFLSTYGIQNLGYGGVLGANPGYIFRGELDYESPLQTSLERDVRNTFNDLTAINRELLKAFEDRKTQTMRGIPSPCFDELEMLSSNASKYGSSP